MLVYVIKTIAWNTYMRRLRGKPREWKRVTKLVTELRELRSSAITTISASGHSVTILPLVSSAFFMLRAGKITLAPLLANTRAVSAPIPDVPPVMMAVMERRSPQVWVTCSAVDLDPKPLGPADPIRYLTVSSILWNLKQAIVVLVWWIFDRDN